MIIFPPNDKREIRAMEQRSGRERGGRERKEERVDGWKEQKMNINDRIPSFHHYFYRKFQLVIIFT